MTYNLSTINASGLVPFTQSINAFTDGWMGILWLIIIMVVFFIGFFLSTRDVGKSATSSLFITFISAVLLRALDLVPNISLFVTLVMFGIAVATTWDRS